MATSNNSRDVKMTLSVETLGAEEIKQLQSSVAALAKQGGDAAPEFQALADEIGRLGEQSKALQAFQQLSVETGTLSQQQQEAAATAGELRTRWEALSETTKEAAAHQRASVAALTEAKQAARETRDELATLTSTTAAADKTETAYTEAVKKLKLAKIEQRAEVERLSASLVDANAAVRDAENAESKLAESYKRAAAAAEASNRALQENTTGVREAGEAAERLGVSTEDVAASQTKLVQGLNQSDAAAERLRLQVAQLADQQRELEAVNAFEKQAEAARRLVTASEYAGLFDQALQKLADTEKEVQAQKTAAKWQRDADAMVEAAEGAKKLAREAELLVAVERELAAQAAFEKQAQDARNLVQAADYVRFWREELDKAEQQAQQTAQVAQVTGQKISDAFRTLGVRSAQELQDEIVQVRAAMETVRNSAVGTGSALNGAFAAGEAKVRALEREIRQTTGALTSADRAAKLFSNSLGQISAGNLIADGVGYLVNKVKELSAAFVGAIVQGDQLKRGLNAVYKDAKITAEQIDFLRKSSSESGVAFGSLTQEFVKFTASMKMSNIPMAQSNELFQAVTAASASLGLGAEATAGTLNALGQMASKGTVSLEELRAQLGDRLPGALGLTAKGLGITEGQLIKLVESGQLATRDFVVPFTRALGELKGSTDGLIPSWERFKGVLSQTAQAIGDAGFTAVLTAALKGLIIVVGTLGNVLLKTYEGIMLLASGAMAVSSAVMGNKDALAKWQVQIAESGTRMAALDKALENAVFGAGNHTSATASNTQALAANTAAAVNAISTNDKLDHAQKLTAISTALSGDATLDAGAKIVQYMVKSAELLKSQSGQTEAFEKLAKAAKEQGDTLVENAKLTGDNTLITTAGLQAAVLYAAAVDKVTVSHSTETAMLVAQRVELEASRVARGLTELQIKTQADELDKLILKSQAETEQSLQAQAAARAEREARKLAVDALSDNSAKLVEYSAAVVSAQKEVDRLRELEAAGVDVKDKLAEAETLLARVMFMRRDAITDLISKTELKTSVESANLQLSIAQASASQNHNTAMAAEARASGDVALAIQYEVQAKQDSIRVLRLKLELDKLQQQSDLLTVDIKRKLYTADTEDNRIKNQLLDIEIQMIKIKQAGNQAILDQIAGIERETTNLRNNSGAKQDNARASGDATAALGKERTARDGNTEAMGREAAALDAINARHGQGKADLAGKYSRPGEGPNNSVLKKDDMKGVDNSAMFTLEQKRNAGTLGKDDLALAQGAFNAATSNLDVFQKNWSVFSLEGAKSIQETYISSRAILDRVKAMSGQPNVPQVVNTQPSKAVVRPAPGQGGPITDTEVTIADYKQQLETANRTGQTLDAAELRDEIARLTAAPKVANATQTININMGGKSTAVNVASESDAKALTAFLRQLESGKGTSA